MATAIKRAKYNGEWARLEALASMMGASLLDFGEVDGLIPVPLHPSRARDRGYNQAFLLATHLGRSAGVPVLDVLRRTRKTAPQVALSGVERGNNVAGAFECAPGWAPEPGGRYVIVDDVRTTGATAGACADALQKAQPRSVGVLTFALDMRPGQVAALKRDLDAGRIRIARTS